MEQKSKYVDRKKFSDDTVGGSTKLSVNESSECYRPTKLSLDGSVTS